MTDKAVRVVDASEPRAGGVQRPLTQVAVGVLFQPDGSFLLTWKYMPDMNSTSNVCSKFML